MSRHLRWPRFSIATLPALTATLLLIVSNTPPTVRPTANIQQPFQVSIGSLTASETSVSPQPFKTREGQRRTELVVRFTNLKIKNLCFSLDKQISGGTSVLRIPVPTLSAGELTVAVDSLDSLGVLGQQLILRNPTAILNAPLVGARQPGFLPIKVGTMTLNLGINFRWVSARQFRVDKLSLAAGSATAECF